MFFIKLTFFYNELDLIKRPSFLHRFQYSDIWSAFEQVKFSFTKRRGLGWGAEKRLSFDA